MTFLGLFHPVLEPSLGKRASVRRNLRGIGFQRRAQRRVGLSNGVRIHFQCTITGHLHRGRITHSRHFGARVEEADGLPIALFHFKFGAFGIAFVQCTGESIALIAHRRNTGDIVISGACRQHRHSAKHGAGFDYSSHQGLLLKSINKGVVYFFIVATLFTSLLATAIHVKDAN